MKRFAAIFLCVILLFSLAACEQDEPSNANKSFQYHLAAEPETLDPQIAADESGIILIQALFEGLTRLDADGYAVPGVAESWTSNADFTQFTFQLREDAVWNDDDNTPVTADDFVYAFQRALGPATNSTTCSPMYCIQNARAVHSGELPGEQLGVSALDAHTLSVQLNTPVKTSRSVPLLPSSCLATKNFSLQRADATAWSALRCCATAPLPSTALTAGSTVPTSICAVPPAIPAIANRSRPTSSSASATKRSMFPTPWPL